MTNMCGLRVIWLLQLKTHSEILKEGTVGVTQVCLMMHINTVFSRWRVSINLIPWHEDRLIIFKNRAAVLEDSWCGGITIGSCRRSLKITGRRDIIMDHGWNIVFMAFLPYRGWIFPPFQRWWNNIIPKIIGMIGQGKIEGTTMVSKFRLVIVVNIKTPGVIIVPASFSIVAAKVVFIIGGPVTTM